MPPSPTSTPPSTASLKAWWKQFTIVQKLKTKPPSSSSPGGVFGVPLRESLRYASVQISTANQNGELYVWGYIPVVVAKCGLFLKEKGTEVVGIFRINGSNRRMRDLQIIFETPPRYGKNIQWQDQQFTPHDVASIFRRFLTSMPEPIIPHSLYHDFRNVHAKKQFNKEEAIREYKRLIGKLPLANQYLLLYVLDLLTVFARKSDINKMTAGNLAVIFRPAVLNHPAHEMSPDHHKLSQEVLEFLIEHQDWFMLDIPPPPRQDSILNNNAANQANNTHRSRNPFGLITNRGPMSTRAEAATVVTNNEPDDLNVYVGPASDEEDDGGWRLAGSTNGTLGRRRTFSERGSPRMMTADEQGRLGGDGRKSVENISQSAPSTSSAFKQATKQLTPVREGSSGDLDAIMLVDTKTRKENVVPAVAVVSRKGTGGSVEAPSTDISSSSNPAIEKRTKFDDTRLAKDDAMRVDDRDKRGRSSSKGTGLFGSVRRSRTVEGTSNTGLSAVVAAAGGTGPQRHVLKKRNSRGEVER